MNRQQIRDLVRKNLGETTSAFWTDDELNLYINNAGHDIAEKTKCIRTNGYMTTVAGTSEYTLSSEFTNLVGVLEVYLKQDGTTWQKLTCTSRTELDVLQPGWLSMDAGTPTKYYADIEEDVLRLHIKPNSSNAGTDYVRVFYATDYTDITDDANTPAGISRDLQLAMVDFATAYGYQQRGWGDKSNDAWAKYFKRLKDYMNERRREKEDHETISKNYRNI